MSSSNMLVALPSGSLTCCCVPAASMIGRRSRRLLSCSIRMWWSTSPTRTGTIWWWQRTRSSRGTSLLYEFGYDNTPGSEATLEQIEAWLVDHDPAEAFADTELTEALPEEIARELHTYISRHTGRTGNGWLKAVKNRGFYVSDKGKGKRMVERWWQGLWYELGRVESCNHLHGLPTSWTLAR